MRHTAQRSRSGFTLTELAVVLAIVGVLAAGLFNLISGASTQVRDNAAAAQQEQLISAVKAFLASQYGDGPTGYMVSNTAGGCGGNCGVTPFALPLPASNTSVTNCQSTYTDPNLILFCTFLPVGISSATTNSYGQTYNIHILRDNTAPGSAPSTYSFMILTSGGNDVIYDTSGARISSLIGGDGGFIYRNAAGVCGNPVDPLYACGAYGAWFADPVKTYGFAASLDVGGNIASRTYYSPNQASNYPWLARSVIDSAFSFNTMQTPEYLGGNMLAMASPVAGVVPPIAAASGTGGAFYMGSYSPSSPNWPNIAGGGTIYMEGGMISGLDTTVPGSPIVDIGTGCTALNASPPNCTPAVLVSTGDVSIPNGELNANTVYAGTFIYQNSGGTSDMRLKTNIRPLADPLDGVMRLDPVSFTFRADGKASLGVIAQNVEKVYPQLVMNGADGMKAVNYNGLIAPLIGAVQELKKENDQMRRQIAEQAARQDKLERELRTRPSGAP